MGHFDDVFPIEHGSYVSLPEGKPLYKPAVEGGTLRGGRLNQPEVLSITASSGGTL